MNQTLRIDPVTHDLVLKDGDFEIIEGDETVAQCVRVTLEVYKGEWFLDENHGTDYERIMGLNPSDDEIQDIIREAIFQETDVQFIDVLEVSRDLTTRRLAVNFKGRLKSGESITLEVGA